MKKRIWLPLLLLFFLIFVRQGPAEATKYVLDDDDEIDFTAIKKTNDGAGSALDSDMLDGMHAADFLYRSEAPSIPVSFTMEWESGDTYFQHYNLKIGVGLTPESGDFVVDADSSSAQTDWTYWGGVNLVSVESTGTGYIYDGLRVQYEVAADTLDRGTVYNVWRRVKNDDSTVWGDYKWLGAVSL